MARPEFEMRSEEFLVHDGPMSRALGKMNVQGGSAYLSNQRFMRFKQSIGLQLLIGLFAFLFKDKPDFEVELGDIKAIARGKQGFNKSVILMALHDGTEYKLICTKFDEWMRAFEEAYGANGRYTFHSLGTDQWAIQPQT
ncbi:MAG: hypothetical protein DHS20C20_04480 [Ardenticatenaceae bacterium]|nr:MAG: hypothetical protein DHS20C20_04480 [Ardenticatenaceae bacterium]